MLPRSPFDGITGEPGNLAQLRFARSRQHDLELGVARIGVHEGERAAVRLRHPSGDRQAESRAARLRCAVARALLVGAIEALEHLLARSGRDAWSMVDYADAMSRRVARQRHF